MRRVWGWDFGDTSTVTVHVRRLREKVERDPSDPRLVVTVRGTGYRFDPEEDDAMSGDMLAVLWTTVAVVLVTGAIGAVVLQAVRHRSLLLSIVVAALVPVAGGLGGRRGQRQPDAHLHPRHPGRLGGPDLGVAAGGRCCPTSSAGGWRRGRAELTAALRGLSASRDGHDAVAPRRRRAPGSRPPPS